MTVLMNEPQQNSPRSKISHERLKELINGLRPDRDLYAGRQFFLRLLDYHGVDGVLSFVGRANVVLDKESDLELHDLNKEEREVFDRTYLKSYSRRAVFGVAAAGLGGAYLATSGVLGVAGQAEKLATGKPLVKEGELAGTGPIDRAHKLFDQTAGPIAYTAIGSEMMHYAYENWMKYRLAEISNAVDKLATKLEKEQKQKPASAAR